MRDASKAQIVSLIVRNSRPTVAAMALRLSAARASFSGDYNLDPGESFRVRAWGAAPGELAIEICDQGLVIRDWPNSVVCVSSVRTFGALHPARHLRIAPAISIRERLHPLDTFEDDDTKPGDR
jgi:hypothetical protein